ncbi:sugar transferase [Phytohalomonas tamaricis]|uniref:sugar transferase n=1 Tax=Phytohalomonas tamaricis TaxID=2081032 RepID=UPI000D0B7E02|nr:sugar transferase [Phytohalomonas tamaricis]
MGILINTMEKNRRHSLWYEKLFFNRWFQAFLGLIIVLMLPALIYWGWGFWHDLNQEHTVSLLGAMIAYAISISAVRHLSSFPGARAFAYIVPTITIAYVVMVGVVLFLGLEYSRTFLFISYVVAGFYCCLGYLVGSKYKVQKLAVVPYGKVHQFCKIPGADWRWLSEPSLQDMRVDGVVADLRGELSDEWQKFLAECTIHRIPVYNARQVYESITGRVHLDHLYENRYGSLIPREDYEIVKRFFDFIAVILVMPFVLPIMAVTALLIKRDDPGPAIFTQQRMGFHCRPFKVYKFRSMYLHHEGLGFTSEGEDPRITRIGKVIRKYRIDELPQLFNVLKGDMSLIGPRPESINLAEWYERDVPFFHYRHVVRPGISGWAQVEQGYAAEVEGMTTKLEYDFYYIKNFSFWLDILIVIRTIKTMLTGFGAR